MRYVFGKSRTQKLLFLSLIFSMSLALCMCASKGRARGPEVNLPSIKGNTSKKNQPSQSSLHNSLKKPSLRAPSKKEPEPKKIERKKPPQKQNPSVGSKKGFQRKLSPSLKKPESHKKKSEGPALSPVKTKKVEHDVKQKEKTSLEKEFDKLFLKHKKHSPKKERAVPQKEGFQKSGDGLSGLMSKVSGQGAASSDSGDSDGDSEDGADDGDSDDSSSGGSSGSDSDSDSENDSSDPSDDDTSDDSSSTDSDSDDEDSDGALDASEDTDDESDASADDTPAVRKPQMNPKQRLIARLKKEFEPIVSQENQKGILGIVDPFTKEQRLLEQQVEPNVTCTDLIQGTLDAVGDGRANLVCDRGMEICLAQESLEQLIKNGEIPWSARDTKRLARYVMIESIRWRRLCEASRLATTNMDFLTTYFYRKKRRTEAQKRPLSREERSLIKLKIKERFLNPPGDDEKSKRLEELRQEIEQESANH